MWYFDLLYKKIIVFNLYKQKPFNSVNYYHYKYYYTIYDKITCWGNEIYIII